MNSREKLYDILRKYVFGVYPTKVFCEQFSKIFDLELNIKEISEGEYKSFKEISDISSRYSPFDEDLKNYDCYYSEEYVRDKAKEILDKLNKVV